MVQERNVSKRGKGPELDVKMNIKEKVCLVGEMTENSPTLTYKERPNCIQKKHN